MNEEKSLIVSDSGVIKRLSAAYREMRYQAELEGMNPLQVYEPYKALTAVPQERGNYSTAPVYSSWADWDRARNTFYSGSQVNYAKEVGDLSGSSLIMSAVRWLGNTLPEAPIMVKENKGSKGESQEIADHPLVRLLRRPNQYYSGFNLWKAFAYSWIISGNAYFLKVRNKARTEVVELWYEPHWNITPRWVGDNRGGYIVGENDDSQTFINYYELSRGVNKYRLEVSDVIHFRDGIDPVNPRLGMSPLNSILREVFTDNQAAHYSARIFKSMGVIPYVIAPKENVQVKDEDLKAVKASLIRQTTGDHLAEPVALGGAVELLKPPAFEPKQMEIKLSRRVPEERFASVTGIPIQVLGFGAGLERSTYSNMQQAYEAAYESYLIPLDRHVDEELTVQALPDFESESSIKNRYVRHDFSQVRALQEDEDSRSKRIVSELNGGMITLNQALSFRGMEAVEGGDVYYIPSNLSVVRVREMSKPKESQDTPPTKSASIPSEDIRQEAVDWYEEVAPEEARDLINAKVKKANGDSEVLNG